MSLCISLRASNLSLLLKGDNFNNYVCYVWAENFDKERPKAISAGSAGNSKYPLDHVYLAAGHKWQLIATRPAPTPPIDWSRAPSEANVLMIGLYGNSIAWAESFTNRANFIWVSDYHQPSDWDKNKKPAEIGTPASEWHLLAIRPQK